MSLSKPILPIPKLDDRNFQDLMEEARSLIPVYDKEWTDHNPSDPGITLLELFSWLSDMLIYRIDQVPEENYRKFLELIGTNPSPDEDIEEGIANGLKKIQQRCRAITKDDYESLVKEYEFTEIQEGIKGIEGRIIGVNNRNLEYGIPDEEKPGHVSVIIIPRRNANSVYCSDGFPTIKLLQEVKDHLDKRRLITTRVHVVGPEYKNVIMKIWIVLKENTVEEDVEENAKMRIYNYFDPITGGPENKGWPLGRNLYRSEIYHLVEGIEGVDHVVKVKINGSKTNYLEIKDHQLVWIDRIEVYHEQ